MKLPGGKGDCLLGYLCVRNPMRMSNCKWVGVHLHRTSNFKPCGKARWHHPCLPKAWEAKAKVTNFIFQSISLYKWHFKWLAKSRLLFWYASSVLMAFNTLYILMWLFALLCWLSLKISILRNLIILKKNICTVTEKHYYSTYVCVPEIFGILRKYYLISQ